tara:strand:- start:234 stop:410 length:177 start_codon:yes stop_codon:yes gene_type:complete
MSKTYEVIVDVVESHVLTIKANTKDQAEKLAEINGCDGEPHYTEVNIISTKELNNDTV